MKVEEVLPKVYLDIAVGEKNVGRIVAELYLNRAPTTVDAFLENLHTYKGHHFDRAIKNFMIQCDNGNLNNESELEKENEDDKFDQPFLLALAGNSVSQFFITTSKSQHLQGKHTCFGRVIRGKSIIREIENVKTGKEYNPVESVKIIGCGTWEVGDPVPIYNACYEEVAGDVFEEYPDDDSHIDKESSASVYRAATAIKNAGGEIFKRGDPQNAFFKYRKALRYVMEYFPDPDEEPDYFAKYTELKKKVYLNMSLATLKLEQYPKCLDYCEYLLAMVLTQQEKAKTFFRKGSASLELRKFEDAITSLKEAQRWAPEDKAITTKLARAEELLTARKKAERDKYAKMFR